MKVSAIETEYTYARKNRWGMVLFALIAFACLFVYFTDVHPLYVFDLDDWLYIYYGRHALPDILEWNPTKVLPETWMSVSGYIGAYFVYPICGDYTQSLSYVFAFVMTTVIVGYVLSAVWVISKRFDTGAGTLTVFSAMFLLGHFLPFLGQGFNNQHLFYANNVTCIFNYTIPSLVSFILCCYFLMEREGKWWENTRLFQKALVVLGVYLVIHSNLLSNIVLMALFGIRLLFALLRGIWENRKQKQKWISWAFLKKFIWENLPEIAAILGWLISMIFEISGERSLATGSGLNLYGAVRLFLISVFDLNPTFLIPVILINLLAIGVGIWRYRRTGEWKFLYWQLEIAACMGLTIVYLILVTAKVAPEYIVRSDVMIAWMVYLMFLTLNAMAYLAKVLPKTVLVLPLLLYILFFETVTPYSTYADTFFSNESASVVKAITDDMIDQVRIAEEADLTAVEVYVPASLVTGWPLDVNLTSERLAKALYHHNIIENLIQVTIVPSAEKDLQFNIG